MRRALRIVSIESLPGEIRSLQAEATAEGFRFVRRLIEDRECGDNRFDGPGERQAGAFDRQRLLAIGGLSSATATSARKTRGGCDIST
jgi:hypothetical protein